MSLIEKDSLKATPDGFEISVRLMWYRSLPLSCVEQVSLAVDGQPVPPQDLRLGLNDLLYRLDELEEIVDQTWYVQDSARIVATAPGRVRKGQACRVEAEVVLRAPYIMIGPGRFLSMPTRCEDEQVAE